MWLSASLSRYFLAVDRLDGRKPHACRQEERLHVFTALYGTANENPESNKPTQLLCDKDDAADRTPTKLPICGWGVTEMSWSSAENGSLVGLSLLRVL